MYAKEWTSSETVRLMSFAEKGLYIDLLNYAWVNDGLPAEPEKIARMVGAGVEEFAALWSSVSLNFVAGEDGRLRNPRQEKERSQVFEKSEKARASAKRRWSDGNANAYANAMRTQSEGSARASGSDSVSGSDSKNQETTNLREFRKPKAEAGLVKRAEALWAAAGFSSPEEAGEWWAALLRRHPNRNANGAAYGRFLERVQLGQFDRTEFERWYEEQVPHWATWPQFPNLSRLFHDAEWRFPKVQVERKSKLDAMFDEIDRMEAEREGGNQTTA
jgi:uncharacterized protein YdaU (DUF1376 family)